jgi:DNA-directed RNA polymerase subunit RPC12/RpoP
MRSIICKNCGEKIEAHKFKELDGRDVGPAFDVAEIYKRVKGIQDVDDKTIRDLYEKWGASLGETKRTEINIQCPKCGPVIRNIFFDYVM